MNAHPARLEMCDRASAVTALPCYVFAAVHGDTTAAQLGTRQRLSSEALACNTRKQSETCWLAAMVANEKLCKGQHTARCMRGRLLRAFMLERMAMHGASPNGQTA